MAENDQKEAKRQKLQSEAQRSAFEEDMARIHAALNGQSSSQPASIAAESREKDKAGCNDTQQHQEVQQQQGGNGNESDEEEGGNWLKKFTPRHTRVGENFQVTDLPIPSAPSHSTSAAVIVPKQ